MAKSVVFSVDLDTESAEAKIEEFIKGSDTARTKLKELSNAAREAALAGNQALSDTFAKAAGEIKDQIGDANAAINNFSSDTRKLDVAVGAVQGLAGAFATVQGTIGLFAGENEKLNETLTKVQSSLAVLNGVQAVAQTLNKESAVGAALYSAQQNILSASIFKTNIALKAFRGALIATGIGAIVVLVGALVANFEKLTEVLNGVGSEQQDLLKTQQKSAELSQKEVEAVSEQENILKLQGKSQRDILKIKAEALKVAIKDQEVVVSTQKAQLTSQIEAAKRNRDILEGLLKFISAPLTLLLKTVDSIGKALGKDFGLEDKFFTSVSELVFDPKQVEENGLKTIQESEKVLNKLKNDFAGTQLAIQDLDKKTTEERTKKAKEAADKAEENRKANEERRLNAIANEQKRELELFDFNRREQRAAAEKAGQDLIAFDAETARLRTDLLAQQEEKRKQDQEKADADALAKKKELYDNELQALKDKNALEDIEAGGRDKLKLEQLTAQATAEKAILDKQLADGIISQEAYNLRIGQLEAELTAKKKTEAEQRKADQQALSDFAVGTGLSALSTLSDLNDAFAAKDEKNARKAFENNKKLQIAQTLIQTFAGAQAAYASALANPISILSGTAYAAIQAGLAVAAGLAQVAKIKAQQFRGGNAGGGGGGGAAGGGGAPATPVAPSAFTGQQASSVVNPVGARPTAPPPQRVFVVESDITSTQDRVKVVENNANAQF